jgi:hypothetical protein
MTSSIALEFLVFLAMDLVAPAGDDDGPVRRGSVAAAARGDSGACVVEVAFVSNRAHSRTVASY